MSAGWNRIPSYYLGHLAMLKTLLRLLLLLITSAVISGCYMNNCKPSVAQYCACSDGSRTEQICLEDGRGWSVCNCTNSYRIWEDPVTALSWQDPQKDAYTKDYRGLTQPDAKRYCKELILGGYSDWRLPNIDELRTLVRGNPSHESSGDCPVREGSFKGDMYDPGCIQAPDYEGPGAGGCYWIPELTGPCDRRDIADEGERALETVSSTVAVDDNFWKADVLFDQGTAVFNHRYSLAEVRCVRNGPSAPRDCADGQAQNCIPGLTRSCSFGSQKGSQVCSADGLCWSPCENTGFTPSPPIEDVSTQCDQLQLNIIVPKQLTAPAKLLVAFLYDARTWTFPNQRPPDGGTDYNQVLNPDIDAGKPLRMTVPATSYYRDRCIEAGEYKLYVALLQSNEWPPWPATAGDYAWGEVQQPLKLQTGKQQIINMEIVLESYSQ